MTKWIDRRAGDGKPLPEPGTIVKYADTRNSVFNEGTKVRVTSWYQTHSNEYADGNAITVADVDSGSNSGYWCERWQEESASFLEGLSEDDKEELARAALEAAEALGYCSESKRVLEKMGLPSEPRKSFDLTVLAKSRDEIEVRVNGEVVEV